MAGSQVVRLWSSGSRCPGWQSREEARKAVARDRLQAITLGCMIESGSPIPEEPELARFHGEDEIFVTVRPKLKSPKKVGSKKTYRFHVEMEADEHVWFVRCPILERHGAATWGMTREEARKHILGCLKAWFGNYGEQGIPIPEELEGLALEGHVSVTICSDRIDYSRLRSLTTRQMIRALSRDGFSFQWSTGSHRHYVHLDGRLVVVPYSSSGGTHPMPRRCGMIEGQARWTMDDLRRLGLI